MAHRAFRNYGSVKAGIRLWNSATSFSPVDPTAAMMAKAINAAMSPYSIAVAPLSSHRNFQSIHSLPSYDGLWHVQVADKKIKFLKL
jgi:hypothetical protein